MKREDLQAAVSRLNQKGKLSTDLYEYITGTKEHLDVLKAESKKYDKGADITDDLLLHMIDDAYELDVNYQAKKLQGAIDILRAVFEISDADANRIVLSNLEFDTDDVTDHSLLANKLGMLRNE